MELVPCTAPAPEQTLVTSADPELTNITRFTSIGVSSVSLDSVTLGSSAALAASALLCGSGSVCAAEVTA